MTEDSILAKRSSFSICISKSAMSNVDGPTLVDHEGFPLCSAHPTIAILPTIALYSVLIPTTAYCLWHNTGDMQLINIRGGVEPAYLQNRALIRILGPGSGLVRSCRLPEGCW